MGFAKKSDFKGGGDHKKTIYRGKLPKKEELGQFADLRLGERGGLGKKEGNGVFEVG